MIRLNLMRNQFGSNQGAPPAPSRLDLEFDSQESFSVRKNRKPLWFALAAVLVGAAGFAGWKLTQAPVAEVPPPSAQGTTGTIPDSTAAAAPVKTDSVAAAPDSVAAAPVDPALAAAARAESLRVVEKARKDSLVLAKASAEEIKAAQAKARKDSIAAAAAARADSIKQAKARREDSLQQAKIRREEALAQEKARRADSIAQAKARKEREKAALAGQVPPERVPATGFAPAVTAPPLAGGVLDFVLGEARGASSAAEAVPTRFEDLTPTGRIAYQRFAFEQILSKLRQVTPGNGIGYSKVRILSPGILVLDGEAQSEAILASLVQGLAAQSLMDTSSTIDKNGRFRITARLPFSSSAAASAALSANFSEDIVRGLDLASAQGLEFGKPAAAKITQQVPFRRASWKLSGTGTWDGCSKWIAALGGVGSSLGFTSLELSSGPDGRLKVTATPIAYGK